MNFIKEHKVVSIATLLVILLALSSLIIFTAPINSVNDERNPSSELDNSQLLKDNTKNESGILPTATIEAPDDDNSDGKDSGNSGEDKPSGNTTTNTKTTAPNNAPKETWYEEATPDKIEPVSQPDFVTDTSSKYNPIINGDVWRNNNDDPILLNLINSLDSTQLGVTISAFLPSELSNKEVTSDVSKAFDEDGKMNPNYYYWTKELVEIETTQIAYALIDPEFGLWSKYQFADSDAKNKFNPNDIFVSFMSAPLVEKYEKAKTYSDFGVYADWNSNDYGLAGVLLPKGYPRWVGQIIDATGTMTTRDNDNGLGGWVLNAEYKVKFTAYTVNKTKITKTGTLSVQFVQSQPEQISIEGLHVRADKVTLKID